MTTNPEYDKPEILKKYSEMFDHDIIMLREDKNDSQNLEEMLKNYKVPVGVN